MPQRGTKGTNIFELFVHLCGKKPGRGKEQGGNGAMELRVGGVYCLPNGRELIVLCKRQNGSVSYRLSGRTGQYEISEEGRLICDSKLTAWDVSNLSDTGRSVGVERSAPQENTSDFNPVLVPS
jgi:hypothetical protein